MRTNIFERIRGKIYGDSALRRILAFILACAVWTANLSGVAFALEPGAFSASGGCRTEDESGASLLSETEDRITVEINLSEEDLLNAARAALEAEPYTEELIPEEAVPAGAYSEDIYGMEPPDDLRTDAAGTERTGEGLVWNDLPAAKNAADYAELCASVKALFSEGTLHRMPLPERIEETLSTCDAGLLLFLKEPAPSSETGADTDADAVPRGDITEELPVYEEKLSAPSLEENGNLIPEGEKDDTELPGEESVLTGDEEIYIFYVNAQDGRSGKEIEFRLRIAGEPYQTVEVKPSASVFGDSAPQEEGSKAGRASVSNASLSNATVARRFPVSRGSAAYLRTAAVSASERDAAHVGVAETFLDRMSRFFAMEVYAADRTPGESVPATPAFATASDSAKSVGGASASNAPRVATPASAASSVPLASARMTRTTLRQLRLPAPPPPGASLDFTLEGRTESGTPLESLPHDGSNRVLYNLADDSAMSFKITIPAAAFAAGEDLKLTVELPKYGVAFADNTETELKAFADRYKSVKLTKVDGQYRKLELVIDKNASGGSGTLITSVATKYAPISAAQAEEILDHGYEESAAVFTLSDVAGSLPEKKNDSYRFLPDSTADIRTQLTSAKVREIWTPTDIDFANRTTQEYQYRGGVAEWKDNPQLRLPMVSEGKAELIKLKCLKIYLPPLPNGARLEYRQVSSSGGSDPAYTGEQEGLVNIFDFTHITEGTDAGGSYISLPVRPNRQYNTGEWYGNVKWKGLINLYALLRYRITTTATTYPYKYWFADTGGVDYAAADTVLEYERHGASGRENVQYSIPGSGLTLHTLPVAYVDQFNWRSGPYNQWMGYNNYQKKTGADGAPTSDQKVVAGAAYTKTSFMSVLNAAHIYNGTVTGTEGVPTSWVENRTRVGGFTEVYDFPEEIQPLKWQSESRTLTPGDLVSELHYTVLHSDGSSTEHTEIFNGGAGVPTGTAAGSAGIVDFTPNLAAGDRVSKVTVKWERIQATLAAGSFFDYRVSDTAAGMVQIGYTGVSTDPDPAHFPEKSFKTAEKPLYLWLEVIGKKCPDLVTTGGSYQRFKVQDLDGSEVRIAEYLALKGLSGGVYKNSLENPRLDLDMKISNVTGLSDQTMMFSGNMTLSPNLSGWKFSLGIYDAASGTSRTAEYTVPTLSADTAMTAADFGLSPDEYFTDIRLSYDGMWSFVSDPVTSASDGKVYDYSWLIKDVKLRKLTHDPVTGARLTTPDTVTNNAAVDGFAEFSAYFSHSDPCEKATHHSADGQYVNHADQSIWNKAQYFLLSNYHYVIEDPKFSSSLKNSTVKQGGSAELTVNFNLKYKTITQYAAAGSEARKLPTDVPEAVYLELTDPAFTIDPGNTAFRASLAAHGMTADDVSVIELSGKRFIKIRCRDAGFYSGTYVDTNDNGAGRRRDNKFTFGFHVWAGAETGNHQPFGEVYYDISELLKKYAPSAAGVNKTVEFSGAAADTPGLLEDGDSASLRLWKGDLSGVTVNVIPETVTGVFILPGKKNIEEPGGSVEFVPSEADSLLAVATIKTPTIETTDYTAVLRLPREGEALTRKYLDASAQVVEEGFTSPYSLYLRGEAKLGNVSAALTNDVVFSYSTDGAAWVDASSVSDWSAVRYVKIVIKKTPTEALQAAEIRLPLKAGKKHAAEDEITYVIGTEAFYKDASAPNAPKINFDIISAKYVYHPHRVEGFVFYDIDEDGVYTAGTDEPAAGIRLRLNEGAGAPAERTAETGADGRFSMAVLDGAAGQVLRLFAPALPSVDGFTVLTATNVPGSASYETTERDSDFERENDGKSGKLTLSAFIPQPMKNISAGIAKPPSIQVDEVWVHVGETSAADAAHFVMTSGNPDPASLAGTYETGTDAAGTAEVYADGSVRGIKSGVRTASVRAKNTLGASAAGKYDVRVYAELSYAFSPADIAPAEPDAAGGTLPTDAGRYYPSPDTNTDKVVLPSAAGLQREGYDFAGWSTDPNLTEEHYGDPGVVLLSPGEEYHTGGVTEDVVFYAKWRAKRYTVRFLEPHTADTPDQLLSSQQVRRRQPATAPSNPNGKTGWHFDRWAKDYSEITEDLDVVAEYLPNHYTVRYDRNAADAVGSTADSQHTYDVAAALTLSGFTRPNYYFAGWNTEQSAAAAGVVGVAGGTGLTDGAIVKNLTAVDGAVVTMYAVWSEAKPVAVTEKVRKKILGIPDAAAAEEEFVFALEPLSGPTGVPLPGAGTQARRTGEGEAAFSPITFTKRGTYRFRMQELPGPGEYYDYDAARYELEYEVTQEERELRARLVSVKKEGETAEEAEAVFTNSYRPAVRYYDGEKGHTPGALLHQERVSRHGTAHWDGKPAADPRGYHFDRWEGKTEDITEDADLTAAYTPNHYYVAYRVNTPPGAKDNGGGVDNDEFIWDVPGKLLHNRFYVKGYRFYGWALKPDGARRYRNDEEILNLTDENEAVVVLYALWSSGDSGGGGGGGSSSGIRGSGSRGGGGSDRGPGIPENQPVPKNLDIPEAPEELPQGAPYETTDKSSLPRMSEKTRTALPVLLGLFAVAAAAYVVLRKKEHS